MRSVGMRKSLKGKSILAAAAGAVVFSSAAYGATGPTLSTFYTTGEIATNSSFTAGTQSISIANNSPTVTVFVPLGDWFQFGVSTVLTNNPNSTAGDAWDLANQ